jgi:hypothetical protein
VALLSTERRERGDPSRRGVVPDLDTFFRSRMPKDKVGTVRERKVVDRRRSHGDLL